MKANRTDPETPREPTPKPHDAPGLSPYERMLELTRRLVNVPPRELAKEKQKEEKRRGH